MNALIIDDERPARIELRRLLSAFPAVDIVGEAATAMEGGALIERLQPDLVFLDIEMPEQNGFELLETLAPPLPQVVFTTAYNAYALQAFEVNALDFLLKPINPRRLAATIAKIEARAAGLGLAAAEPPGTVPAGALRADDQVFVRDGDRCWFVPVRSLRLLEADGNHTRIHFSSFSPLLYRTLSSMEARLPAELFVRANRSQLVNVGTIATIRQWFSGSLKATLADGSEIEFSRRQAQVFRERMSL